MLALIFLFGCSAEYIPPKDIIRKEYTAPRLHGSSVALADGETLYAVNTIIDSDQPIIVGIHGLGGNANDFYYFINYARQNNISFFAVDLRGFGHWRNNRGDLTSLKLWIKDIEDVVQAMRKMYPHRKIILMGESLGASVIYWYCSENKNMQDILPDGLISMSIVTRPGSRIKFRNILEGTIGYFFYPKKSITIEGLSKQFMEDPENSEFIKNNPLKLNKVSFRFLLQARHIIDHTPDYISQLHIPLLVFQGGQDTLSQSDDVMKIVERMKVKEFIYMEECTHSLLTGKCRDSIFSRIKDWVYDF